MNTNIENKIKKLFNTENHKFPIIEKIDTNYSNVTFVYIANEKLNNIIMVLPIGSKSLSKNKMHNINDTNIWYKTYRCRNNIKFLYYFSINDSLSIRTPRNLNALSVDTYNDKYLLFNEESKVSYLEMPNCKEDITNKIVLNNLSNVIHKELFSKYLYKNISISIYLPPNFDPLKEYGLALFTDGDEHLTLLKTDKILDHLILKNKIKPMLGLFIDSNESRMKELICDQDFENFIIKEALPFIKNNYKLSKNPKDNLISGFSLGGLTAMHLGLKHNTIFGNVLSQSGSFFFKMSEMRKLIYKTSKKPQIYLNFGVLEDKKRVINGNLKIYAILKKHKFKVSLECFYSGHDYLSWSEYLYRSLLELLALH